MKLIDAAQAGKILSISNSRVRYLIKRGHLKDHSLADPNKQKHYARLDVSEVKEFNRNYKVGFREITIRQQTSRNGQEVKSNPTEVNLPIPTPPSFKSITLESRTPVQSFNERLQRIEDQLVMIEDKLNTLLKVWV